ncbi:hypothetical protein B0H14DRAFT_3600576 [Mycena olivaceomarginata]|nr:hypothetical protein B0H14DRAFT_3600576 [Mycena olivaceomarginata]
MSPPVTAASLCQVGDIPVAEAAEALESKSWSENDQGASPSESDRRTGIPNQTGLRGHFSGLKTRFRIPFLVPQSSGIPACLPGATNERRACGWSTSHDVTSVTSTRLTNFIRDPTCSSPTSPSFSPPASRAWTSPPGTTTSAQCRPPASPASPAAPPGLTPPPATRTTSTPTPTACGASAARADELEGLLAGHDLLEFPVKRRDDDADADAISLHSHLGSRGRRRTPPRTLKHTALWSFNVLGRARGVALEGGDEALHPYAHLFESLSSSEYFQPSAIFDTAQATREPDRLFSIEICVYVVSDASPTWFFFSSFLFQQLPCRHLRAPAGHRAPRHSHPRPHVRLPLPSRLCVARRLLVFAWLVVFAMTVLARHRAEGLPWPAAAHRDGVAVHIALSARTGVEVLMSIIARFSGYPRAQSALQQRLALRPSLVVWNLLGV